MEVDASRVVLSVLPLSSFDFREPGRYSFELYCDGALVGASALTITTSHEFAGASPSSN